MSKQLRFFSANLDSGGTIVHVGDMRRPDRVDCTLSEINAGIAANPGAPLEDVLIALLAKRGVTAHMPERPKPLEPSPVRIVAAKREPEPDAEEAPETQPSPSRVESE